MLLYAATNLDDIGMTPATEHVRGKEGTAGRSGIGLDRFDAMLFDMDGVITRSAKGHGELWKVVFDDFLKEFSARHNLPFKPFDAGADYHDFVDGKPRPQLFSAAARVGGGLGPGLGSVRAETPGPDLADPVLVAVVGPDDGE